MWINFFPPHRARRCSLFARACRQQVGQFGKRLLTHTLFTFFHFLIEGISSGLKFNSFYLKISNHLKGNLWALFHEKTYVAVLSADYTV